MIGDEINDTEMRYKETAFIGDCFFDCFPLFWRRPLSEARFLKIEKEVRKARFLADAASFPNLSSNS